MNEITYENIPADSGKLFTISYRKVGETVTGKGIWDYYPHGIDEWIPVRNPRIIRNLDEGKHPPPNAKTPRPARSQTGRNGGG
jgi:hypothetical protein